MKQIKCILLGDSDVGKTSILCRLNGRDMHPPATIGVDTVIYEKDDYKVICWDTAGQDKFEIITASFLRSATIAIYVYDVNRPTTFHKAYDWYKRAMKMARRPRDHILVGNKSDLKRKVTDAMIANTFGTIQHVKCSTIGDDTPVTHLFDCVIQLAKNDSETHVTLDLHTSEPNASASCCCLS